jgi:hypothetical protein
MAIAGAMVRLRGYNDSRTLGRQDTKSARVSSRRLLRLKGFQRSRNGRSAVDALQAEPVMALGICFQDGFDKASDCHSCVSSGSHLAAGSIIHAIDRVRWSLGREGQKSWRVYQGAAEARDDSALPARQRSAVARPVEERKAIYTSKRGDR